MGALRATPRGLILPLFVELRLATLAAYGGSLILFHHAERLAETVYNNLCSREGITFAKPTSVTSLLLIMGVIAAPTLIARSRALVITNFAAALITVGAALILESTASDTPYECFTMGGNYEDHTSGILGFVLWGAFVLLVSLALLFVDLSVWAFKKVTAGFR